MDKKERGGLCHQLETRRRYLRMPINILAHRSSVSYATVRRILAGEYHSISFRSLEAVAKALGMSWSLTHDQEPEEFKRAQAIRKAKRLVGMVQATQALESQAVESAEIDRLVGESANRLLVGSQKRLWSE